MYELLNPFVELAFGKQYLFTSDIVLILCINFFISGTRRAMIIFKESMGLFWYDRHMGIVEAILNLVISLFLVKHLGIVGVFLGTFCSTVMTAMWAEPYILYKYRFHKSPVRFFLNYGWNLIVMTIVWWCTDWLCGFVEENVIVEMILRFIICMFVPNLLLFLIYFRTQEYKELQKLVYAVIKKAKTKIIHIQN